MSKLIMMRGLPASGKSTKAKKLMEEYGNFYRLNKDKLREMLHFGKYTGPNEGVTHDIQVHIARTMLLNGQNLIIDDTNLGKRHEDRWKSVAKEADAKFELVNLDTSVEVCLDRDSKRKDAVGYSVIMGMTMEYGYYTPKKGYVICDIDGTVANIGHRLEYVKKDPKEWEIFFSLMKLDTVNDAVVALVRQLQVSGYDIVYMSGRPERYRKQTEWWLQTYVKDIVCTNLIMRPDHNKEPDHDLKKKMLHRYFPGIYKSLIHKVIDDRPSVIKMWREEGLDVEDVGKGVEF